MESLGPAEFSIGALENASEIIEGWFRTGGSRLWGFGFQGEYERDRGTLSGCGRGLNLLEFEVVFPRKFSGAEGVADDRETIWLNQLSFHQHPLEGSRMDGDEFVSPLTSGLDEMLGGGAAYAVG
jgi:hypothetical protein